MYFRKHMHLIKNTFFCLAAAVMFMACGENPYGPTNHQPETEKPKEVVKGSFAEGADISWVTEMETKGMKFYNSDGKETECTALMKEIGFNAIRLRVWVNPKDGFCGTRDVVEKAERAQALGMRLMIDFHYSDSWADPGQQNVPEAWKSFDVSQMEKAVADHTSDVLQALKDNKISIEWIQIGNEVNTGMLWPSGKVQDKSAENFVKYLNAGYGAAKEVYPESKVILHVSNGHDSGLFGWFFNLMKLNGAKYDMIGMSLYPSWWENGGFTTGWKAIVDNCLANMKSMTAEYGKPVMLCETGMPCSQPEMSKEAIQYILEGCRAIKECHGVFYWEPEAPDGYNGGYGLGAFKDGRPTAALDPFKD